MVRKTSTSKDWRRDDLDWDHIWEIITSTSNKILQSLSIEDAEEQIYKARQQLVPYKIKRIIVDENYNDMSKLS